MWAVAMNKEVAEQFLIFARFETFQRLGIEKCRKLSKQSKS